MTIDEFEGYLRELFGAKLARDSGFTHIGRREVHKLGYAVNVAPQTLEEAVRQRVDLMLTHHDPWQEVYGLKEYCLQKLQRYDMTHFYLHPALDDCEFGTGASLLVRLGGRVIEKGNQSGEWFWGRIGEFDPPVDLAELVQRLEAVLEEPVLAWRNNSRSIRRAVVVPGQGWATSEVRDAVCRGCDVYITGEKLLYTVSYAQFAGINLIVASHTFSEAPGMESLAQRIARRFPEVQVLRLHEDHLETLGRRRPL
ncbi:MAG: Nif3-like dinuclear metal center hexameric protein [Anaerolineae bacterium]|nr:Nif3-like dinuclear metal center hexameric protein [Anaerolineae bacterium]